MKPHFEVLRTLLRFGSAITKDAINPYSYS